jgi:hypothetical protein
VSRVAGLDVSFSDFQFFSFSAGPVAVKFCTDPAHPTPSRP